MPAIMSSEHINAMEDGLLKKKSKKRKMEVQFSDILNSTKKNKTSDALLSSQQTDDDSSLSGKRTLYVTNIPFNFSNMTIKEHFTSFGTLREIFEDNSQKFLQVTFKSKKAFKKAVSETHIIGGQRLQIYTTEKEALVASSPSEETPEPTEESQEVREQNEETLTSLDSILNERDPNYKHQIYVNGLDSDTKKKTIRRHFEQYGNVVNVVKISRENEDRSCAFVAFEKRSEVKAASSIGQQQIGLSAISITGISSKKQAVSSPSEETAEPTEESQEVQEQNEETLTSLDSILNEKDPNYKHQIYINGLDSDTKKKTIRRHFEQYGNVVNVKKISRENKDGTRVFIAFEKRSEVKAASSIGQQQIGLLDVSITRISSKKIKDEKIFESQPAETTAVEEYMDPLQSYFV